MDKNVGSVNLDELKAAREALNRDLGIENDPNMYNDYDPEKHKAEKEQEKLARAQELEEMAGGVSADENNNSTQNQSEPSKFEDSAEDEENLTDSTQDFNSQTIDELGQNEAQVNEDSSDLDDDEIITQDEDSQIMENIDESNLTNETVEQSQSNESISLDNDYARSPEVEAKIQDDKLPNFDVYDNFADFEVNSGEIGFNDESVKTEEKSDSISEKLKENVESSSDEDETGDSLDDFLTELDTILQKEDDDEEIVSDDDNVSLDVELESLQPEENQESADDIENVNTESEAISSDIQDDKVDDVENNLENTLKVEDVIKTQPVENVTVPIINDDEPFSKLEKFDVSNESNEIVNESNKFEVDILDNFKLLSEINQEDETAETTESIENEITDDVKDDNQEELDDATEEVEVGGYEPIENFNFVDVMSSEEFKKTDKMSYVLGKDSDGEVVYGNLRDTCGTVMFTRDEDVIHDGFSSILLSLLLKNTPNEVQFVVCDAMFDSEFDVFNNSSYMYFNRVAKNNREIVDSLLELSKELEKRYNNLVYAGVKSISAYNLQAEERGAQKMPYVVLFLNNYAKMTQFLDADRINTCLYNILKFGRIVGVYAMVASTSEIERNDINYNLPTRICYKTEDAHDSIAALGRAGAENLKDERDFLYSTVYDEELRHLKVPSLTRKEIELIIENLEK